MVSGYRSLFITECETLGYMHKDRRPPFPAADLNGECHGRKNDDVIQ